MIPQRLRVQRHSGVSTGRCKGILFYPATTDTWLRELCSWDVDIESLALYLCPSGLSQEPKPALLILGEGLPTHVQISSIPLQAAGERILYPVGSELLPELTDSEKEQLPGDGFLFVLPRLGQIQYREQDRVDPAFLLELPDIRSRSWLPMPVLPPLERRFLGTEWAVEAEPEELLQQGKEDIGEEKLKDLPETLQDKARKRTGPKLPLGMAKALFRVAQWVPTSPGQGETWVNKMENWASQRLRQDQWENQSQRDKEVQRLLDMLKENPKEGLKFAIPLSSLNQARGKAPAGNTLSSRNTSYNFRNLGGGGAVDPWHIEANAQEQLRQQYRNLAKQEEQRGAYRRAAYIYAELLGDLPGAASALERGGFYSEAGEIWQKKLHDPLQAARLFAKAGQLQRAIDLYLKQRARLQAVELYRQLGCEEEAQALLEEEVQELIGRRLFLRAANFAENELEDPERALAILQQGWPDSVQALECKVEYLKKIRKQERLEEWNREWKQLEREAQGKLERTQLTLQVAERIFPSLRELEQDQHYDRMLRMAQPWVAERNPVILDNLRAVTRKRIPLQKDLLRFRQQNSQSTQGPKPESPRTLKAAYRFEAFPDEAELIDFCSTASKFALLYKKRNEVFLCVGTLSGTLLQARGSLKGYSHDPKLAFHPSGRMLYLFCDQRLHAEGEALEFPDKSRVSIVEVGVDAKSVTGSVSSSGTYFSVLGQPGRLEVIERQLQDLRPTKYRPNPRVEIRSRYSWEMEDLLAWPQDITVLRSRPCVLADDRIYFCDEPEPEVVKMLERGDAFLPTPHPCNHPELLPVVHLESGTLFCPRGPLKKLGVCSLACATHKGEILALNPEGRIQQLSPHQPEAPRVLGSLSMKESYSKLWAGMKPGSFALLTKAGEMQVYHV